MGRGVWKILVREIRQNPGRFLSIFFIVVLGTAFLSGVRACEPDMRQSMNQYLKQHRYMDFRIQSGLGLTDADVRAVRKVPGVSQAVGAYSVDVLSDFNNTTSVLTVMSTVRGMNRMTVKQGRLPVKENECLIDTELAAESKMKVGGSIHVYSGTKEKLAESLRRSTFKIVGIGSYPGYLTGDRGHSSIGSGTVDGFIAVNPSAFSMSSYSVIFCRTKSTGKYATYSDAYTNHIKQVKKQLSSLGRTRAEIRKHQLMQQFSLAAGSGSSPGMLTQEKQLAQIRENGKWYIFDRSEDQAYTEYRENASRIGAIGRVFPVIFFLVAVLVSLTTMTRMVEEDRGQIGLLGALGYGRGVIVWKYAGYGLLAAVSGSIAGVLTGEKFLPYIIVNAYRHQFVNLDQVVIPYEWKYSVLAGASASACILAAALRACGHLLREVPAELMHPEAPKGGNKIWMEYITPLWSRMSFSVKAAMRNIFRYKKRLFMTIIGVGACTALLLTGFGIRDSVLEITGNQYQKIWTYDAQVYLNPQASVREKKSLNRKLSEMKEISGAQQVYEKGVQVGKEGHFYDAALVVPENPDRLDAYIHLHDRVTGKKHRLKDHSAVLSEKAAAQLHVKAGSMVILKQSGGKTLKVRVGAVTENYIMHYIYISPEYYRSLTGKRASENSVLLKWGRGTRENETAKRILKQNAVSQIVLTSDARNSMRKTIQLMGTVVGVLSAAAAMLAFVVIFSLNTISITERRRELATLKVLGFYDREVEMYIFRENIMLTLLSIVLGLFMGVWLEKYIMLTAETNDLMFGRTIAPSSFILAAALTVLFTVIVNAVSSVSMRKIDMIESLKSTE